MSAWYFVGVEVVAFSARVLGGNQPRIRLVIHSSARYVNCVEQLVLPVWNFRERREVVGHVNTLRLFDGVV